MVSGFLISPNDQLRILSGLAMPIRISSNVSGLAIGLAKGVSSFISFLFLTPLSRAGGAWGWEGGPAAHPSSPPACERGIGSLRGQRRRVFVRCDRIEL